MEFYRSQTKHDQIMNKLNTFITTEYAIYPNFAIVEFFEFVITNPYNEPHTITIVIDDPELQVVEDGKEWRHLKLLHQVYSQVEDNMFHRRELDANNAELKYPQVYMRAKETLNIPLKYQTFRADNRVHVGGDANGKELAAAAAADEENAVCIRKTKADSSSGRYELKRVHVHFRAEDKSPIALLRLIVDQQSHVVNQTFRFSECEHSFLKKTIRVPSSYRALASNATALLQHGDIRLEGTSGVAGVDGSTTSQLYVRTSDPNVVVESRAVLVGEPHDIFIKVTNCFLFQ